MVLTLEFKSGDDSFANQLIVLQHIYTSIPTGVADEFGSEIV